MFARQTVPASDLRNDPHRFDGREVWVRGDLVAHYQGDVWLYSDYHEFPATENGILVAVPRVADILDERFDWAYDVDVMVFANVHLCAVAAAPTLESERITISKVIEMEWSFAPGVSVTSRFDQQPVLLGPGIDPKDLKSQLRAPPVGELAIRGTLHTGESESILVSKSVDSAMVRIPGDRVFELAQDYVVANGQDNWPSYVLDAVIHGICSLENSQDGQPIMTSLRELNLSELSGKSIISIDLQLLR